MSLHHCSPTRVGASLIIRLFQKLFNSGYKLCKAPASMFRSREHEYPRSSCVQAALGQTATGIGEGIMLISIKPYLREYHLSCNKYVICTVRITVSFYGQYGELDRFTSMRTTSHNRRSCAVDSAVICSYLCGSCSLRSQEASYVYAEGQGVMCIALLLLSLYATLLYTVSESGQTR
jgi:hypothetical protein